MKQEVSIRIRAIPSDKQEGTALIWMSTFFNNYLFTTLTG